MFKKIEGIYNVAKTIAKTLKGNKTSDTIKYVKPGKLGQRARFAITLGKLRKK